MREPRFIVSPKLLSNSTTSLTLEGQEAHHMTKVLRLLEGARVCLVDGAGQSVSAEIARIKKKEVDLLILEKKRHEIDLLQVEVIISLLKKERMEWLIQKLTELGVDSIRPVLMEHTSIRPNSTQANRSLKRWNDIARQGLKQCRGYFLPKIHPVSVLGETVRELTEQGMRILLWENERERTLPSILVSNEKPKHITLLIGPEGGISSREITFLKGMGFRTASVSNRILRSETAAVAGAAMACAFLMERKRNVT